MQARSPMQVLLSVKSVASQFLAKPRIVYAEAPQMPRREAASRYSRFPRSGKRLLTGLFVRRSPRNCAIWRVTGLALLLDAQGNLSGTTSSGGSSSACQGGCGTVFMLTPNGSGWTETVIYNFTGGADGGPP